jgi:hypothetical protein
LFKQLQERPYDLLVTAKGVSAEGGGVRKLEIFHSERNVVYNRVFSRSDLKYVGQQDQLLADAYSCLLSHIKSRIHAHQDFHVWFYTAEECEYILEAIKQRFAGDTANARAVEKLSECCRVSEANGSSA